MADDPADRRRLDADAEASALAELALCENLSQTSGWAAKWSAELARADAALLWAPDTVNPHYLCIGAWGPDTNKFRRRSVARGDGFVGSLSVERRPVLLTRSDFADSRDPWLKSLPEGMEACLALPLESEGTIVAILALLFRRNPAADEPLARLQGFVQQAAPALARALRADRKTVGMLHAIERLTNLYDLSKAFGSTIDLDELETIIVHKAADFGVAEVASLWFFEPGTAEVILVATAVNENYEVEKPPDAVGSSIVGDLLADRKVIRRGAIPPQDPVATESEGYTIRSLLAFPLVEDERPVGALVMVNKRGRVPDFTAEDEELLQDLARQAVRAIRNAREHEAEKKVEELDALLTVSREITSTLDLDKVMKTVVNGSAALIAYERSAIAILQRGHIRLGALSGKEQLDRRDPKLKPLEDLLQWIYFSGADVFVEQDPDGRIVTERPETLEKFRAYFQATGFRSFHAVLLKDDEGKLGVLSFESRKPLAMDEGRRDLLGILVNQATVAVRNAQLYTQVPLAGFWKPILERRDKFREVPRQRRLAWAAGTLVALLVLFFVPWRIRVSGPARILPGQRAAATVGVDGIVASVLHREGESVAAGEVIATLKNESYAAALEEARSGLAIAESDVARFRDAGDAAATAEASSRRDELTAKIVLQSNQLAQTQIRAPAGGLIVTPRIDERVGQFLARGSEFCVIADVRNVTAEVAVPESDAALIRTGEVVSLKLNSYPTRTFRGSVARVGSHVREEGENRFLIAEVRVENGSAPLKTGMLGKAKVSTQPVPMIAAIFRKPVRYIWTKLWPILP